ncbi:hypothetical protein PLUTE_a2918 [Pseudoalteromonas luteoviolacea DSM 6061]|nr:hypothetical protein [Pseudoalteromonas luteoviolacea DSM 6061]
MSDKCNYKRERYEIKKFEVKWYEMGSVRKRLLKGAFEQ